MAKLKRLTCYELEPGEADDGTHPTLHQFTLDEACAIQEYLESGIAISDELRNKAAIAFAHASTIKIGD